MTMNIELANKNKDTAQDIANRRIPVAEVYVCTMVYPLDQ